jgi:adenine-specific DNA-methyltransferase
MAKKKHGGEPESDPAGGFEKIDLVSGSNSNLLETLRSQVPAAFTDGVLNTDELLRALGVNADSASKYQLQWTGKDEAVRAQQVQSYGSLHPDRKVSVKFDDAENVFIEGDNLEVLRLLQRAYNDQVKLIYIDPPYNTTNDFVYNDDFTDSLDTYLRYTKQRDEEGKMTSATAESGGRRHSGWLTMMYPRLALARNLLTRDGLIFVSIDDHEIHNLRHMLDSIFGLENFLATLVWNRGHSQQQGQFKEYHEYVVVYARDRNQLQTFADPVGGEVVGGALKKISRSNPESTFEFPAGVRCEASDGTEFVGTWGDAEKVRLVSGEFVVKGGRTTKKMVVSAGWTQKEQMRKWFAGERPVFDSRGQEVLEFYFNSTGKLKYVKNRTAFTPPTVQEWGTQGAASAELVSLLGCDIFDRPKPVKMLQDIIAWSTSESDLVMDLFAGSGTLGHAVLNQNLADGSSRRFILVNLPETIDPKVKPDVEKMRVSTVADVARIRLKQAAAQLGVKKFSIRCLTLGESNFKIWDPAQAGEDADSIAQALSLFKDSLRDGATDDAIALELLLKEGVPLGTPWKRLAIAGTDAIQAESVVVSLARTTTKKFVEVVLQTEGMSKLLMLDQAFEHNDQHKANLLITAREQGITVRVA